MVEGVSEDSRNPRLRSRMYDLYTNFTLKEIPCYPLQQARIFLSREDLAEIPEIGQLLPATNVFPKTLIKVVVGNSDLGLDKSDSYASIVPFLPIKIACLDVTVLEWEEPDSHNHYHPFHTGLRITSSRITDRDDNLVSGSVGFIRRNVTGEDEDLSPMRVEPEPIVEGLNNVIGRLRQEFAKSQRERRARVLRPSEEALISAIEKGQAMFSGINEYAVIGGLKDDGRRLKGMAMLFSLEHHQRGTGEGREWAPDVSNLSVSWGSGERRINARTSFLIEEEAEGLTYFARGRLRLLQENSSRAIRNIPVSIIEDDPFGVFTLNDIRGQIAELFGDFVEGRSHTPEDEERRGQPPIILASSIPLVSLKKQVVA